MRYHVLDLSAYNRKWDFAKARKAGIHGAILKSSQYKPDAYFQINREGLLNESLLDGAYHYFVPSKPAKAQAEMMWELVKGMPLRLGAWLDLEYNAPKYVNGVYWPMDGKENNPALFSKNYGLLILEFMEEFYKLSGVYPGIYTGPAFSYTNLAKWEILSLYALWLSNPQESLTRTIPNCPKPFFADSWMGWQYTFKLQSPTYYGAPPDSIKGLDANIFRWIY